MNFYQKFDHSMSTMIDSLKYILYNRHQDIFERLDFENDSIFLEPLIYSYVHQDNDDWLDCVIYGYENQKKAEIQVFSNSLGVVYLPNVGYFKTNKYNSRITLKTLDEGCFFFIENEEIEYKFENLTFLSSGVELVIYNHPLFEELFNGGDKQMFKVIDDKIYIDMYNKAFDIIKWCNPKHFALLQKSLKKVMLFKAEQPNSFAVLAAHNMIFLNVRLCHNAMFFIDHISHEGAHVTFHTITHQTKAFLFNVPYHSSYAEVSGRSGEHSTLYLSFHGLFTFFEITKTLDSYIRSGKLSTDELHEAKARMVFQLFRFKYALNNFNNLDVFENEGKSWLLFFNEYFVPLENEYGCLKSDYDFKGQPYDFDYVTFKVLNPSN